MNTIKSLLTCLALSSLVGNVYAQDTPRIDVKNPYARVSAPTVKVSAAFMTLTNQSKIDDILLSVETSASEKTELHRSQIENGVMKMREVKGGIQLPQNKAVQLAPGGLHIMLLGLKKPLIKGQKIPLTLNFKHHKKLHIDLDITNTPETMEKHDHHHDHGAHHHH